MAGGPVGKRRPSARPSQDGGRPLRLPGGSGPAPPCLRADGPRGEAASAPLRTSARRDVMGRVGRRLPAVAAVLYGALAALVLLGVRDVLFVYEENRCSMTYMYEYPEYLVSWGCAGREAAAQQVAAAGRVRRHHAARSCRDLTAPLGRGWGRLSSAPSCGLRQLQGPSEVRLLAPPNSRAPGVPLSGRGLQPERVVGLGGVPCRAY